MSTIAIRNSHFRSRSATFSYSRDETFVVDSNQSVRNAKHQTPTTGSLAICFVPLSKPSTVGPLARFFTLKSKRGRDGAARHLVPAACNCCIENGLLTPTGRYSLCSGGRINLLRSGRRWRTMSQSSRGPVDKPASLQIVLHRRPSVPSTSVADGERAPSLRGTSSRLANGHWQRDRPQSPSSVFRRSADRRRAVAARAGGHTNDRPDDGSAHSGHFRRCFRVRTHPHPR